MHYYILTTYHVCVSCIWYFCECWFICKSFGSSFPFTLLRSDPLLQVLCTDHVCINQPSNPMSFLHHSTWETHGVPAGEKPGVLLWTTHRFSTFKETNISYKHCKRSAFYRNFCRWFRTPANQLIGRLSRCLQGFWISQVVGLGFLHISFKLGFYQFRRVSLNTKLFQKKTAEKNLQLHLWNVQGFSDPFFP